MRGEKGIALVAALGLLLVMSVLVLGTFWTTQLELWTTRNDTTSVQAFYVAEAGLQKYKAALFNQYIWQERNLRGGSPTGKVICYSSFADGIDWNRNEKIDPGERFEGGKMTLAQNEPVPDANGNPVGYATVELYPSNNPKTYTLVSYGTSNGAKARIQATFFIETPSPLNLAIFAGGGAANKWLNGGATIRGGLYIEGDPNNPEAEVISSNGNFSLLNWYDLSGYGPLAQAVSPAGRRADDLCATLRVRFGKVSVGGSTQIGEPKNKLKGVYVSRGRDDITGQLVDVCQANKGVCTEALGPFDLSDPPPFPTLDGPGGCGGSLSWRDCLRREASLRVVRGAPIGWPVMSLPTNPQSCLQAFSGGTLTLGSQEVDCSYTLPDGTKGGFKYTPGTPATLEVYGTVVLEGYDVVLGGDVRYRAQTNGARNASLVVLKTPSGGGNLTVKGSLLPDTALGTFPEHVLGLVAEGDVYQMGPYMTAPVYAGGTFRIVQKNVLLGSVITNEFCTTSAGGTNCNAGQRAEVIFVNTAGNRPQALKWIDELAGRPTFQVLSYERR